jgi:hypothetical protein
VRELTAQIAELKSAESSARAEISGARSLATALPMW